MNVSVRLTLDKMLRGLRWSGHALAEAAEREGVRVLRRKGIERTARPSTAAARVKERDRP